MASQSYEILGTMKTKQNDFY